MVSPSRFDDARAAALRRSLTVGAVTAIVAGVVLVVALSPVIGVVALVVLSAAWVLLVTSAFSSAPARALGALGGSPVGGDAVPRLANALEGAALLTGVERPAVRLIDSAAANAAVVAGADGATVVATRGLIEDARPVELEVLAAELLCRVRDGSAAYAALAAGMPGWLAGIAGLSPGSVAGVLGEQRSMLADLDAISVTRYPPGLVAALERMVARGTVVAGAAPSTAALWVAPASDAGRGLDPAVDRSVNQPLELRIAVLREL
jgi:heat shock protein HtpX